MKDLWMLPLNTYKFVVDQLMCDLTPTNVDILSRYPKFVKGLLSSSSKEARAMAFSCLNDLSTTTGRNLKMVESVSGLDPLQTSKRLLKERLNKLESCPENKEWILEVVDEG